MPGTGRDDGDDLRIGRQSGVRSGCRRTDTWAFSRGPGSERPVAALAAGEGCSSVNGLTGLHDLILPALGPVRIRLLHRARIKALLAEKLQAGLARNSVRLIHATLRTLLPRAGAG